MRKFLVRHKKSLVVFLTLLLLVGGVGGFFGSREVLKRRIVGWRADGIAAARAGDHAKAADLLVKYLQRRPEDPDALRVYIDSREKAELPNGGHYSLTIAALRTLLNQAPDALDDRRHLLELYAKLDQRPETLDVASTILAKHPNDVRTLEIKTATLTKLRKLHDALGTAAAWASAAPQDITPLIARIGLRVQLGHPAEAVVAEAASLRESHPGDVRYELLQGIACAETGDPAAGRWLKAVAAHDDLSFDLARILVVQFDNLGLGEESVGVLTRMVERGADAKVRHVLGRRLWESSQWAKAAAALADVDPATGDATLVALRASAAVNAGDKATSVACREALAARPQAAAQAWTLILPRLIDAAVTDDKKLVAECDSALATDPDDTYLGYYRGEASARLGELDAAIDAWRRVVGENSSWTLPPLRLVEALLQKGRPEQALVVATAAAKRNPSQASAVIALARAWSAGVEQGGVGHADELLRLVEDVQKQLPADDQTLLIRIKLLCQKDMADEARRGIRAALDRQPPPGEPLLLALATLSRENKLALAGDCFAKSEALHGVTPDLAYARAIDAAPPDGLKAFDTLAAGKTDVTWKLARARYLDAVGHADARSAWTVLGDASADDLTVQQSAAVARSVRGEWAFQERTIDRLKKLTGENGLAWRLARARLDVEAARDDSDSERGALLLTDLVAQYPNVAEIRVLLARALFQLKRTGAAIEHLTVASKLDPTSVPIALQLAGLLQSRGDFERVNQELDRVSPQLKTAADRRRAASLLAEAGRQDKAVSVMESARQRRNGEAAEGDQDDLMLAVLYVKNGQTAEATELLRKIGSTSNVAGNLQYAASYFATRHMKPEAETALARLDGLTTDPGVKAFTRGICLGQLGDLPAAALELEKAVTEAPANAVPWRALAMCRAMQGQGPAFTDVIRRAAAAVKDDKALNRLQAAGVLAEQAVASPAIRPLVLDAVRSPDDAETALETLALVHDAAQTGDRERAAARMQQLADRAPTYLPLRLQLVECYRTMGRNNDAMNAAKQAMAAFPSDPLPVRAALRIGVDGGRWAEVRELAYVWGRREPAAVAEAAAVAGQADIGLGDFAGALSRLKPYVTNVDPNAAANAITLYAIAAFNAGKADAATEVLWPVVRRDAAWRERGLQVALSIGDGPTAVAWLDRMTTIVPADDLRCRTILAEGYEQTGRRTGDATAIARGVALMNECVQSAPASGAVLIAAAAQADRSGDAARAEGLYRRALAAEPGNWVAQNNLATLMTGRGTDLPEAVRLATEATRSNPAEPAVYDTLAAAQAKAESPKAAVETMRRAVQLSPDDPQWYLTLSRYQAAAGDQAGAAKTIAAIEARRLDGDSMSVALRQELADARKRLRTNAN